MLAANEFMVGSLGETTPLTLVLPYSEYGDAFLVGSSDGEPVAVCLGEGSPFQAFKSAGNDSWGGLLIPGVHIEVAEKSAYDAMSRSLVFGAVICSGSGFMLNARSENLRSVVWPIVLGEGSTAASPPCAAGFQKWSVMLGSGQEKRVLFEVSVGGCSSSNNR